MLNKKSLIKGLVLSSVMTLSQITMASSMRLDENLSNLSFVSIKNGTVAEAHSIPKLTGSISDSGQLEIKIFLTTVETNIPIRNTRMHEHLFDINKTPVATITADIKDMIPDSGVAEVETEGELTMRGIKNKIKVTAVVASTNKQVLVSSVKPIIIKASDYGMEEGVKKLQGLAMLSSIATAVPVNFVLAFTK